MTTRDIPIDLVGLLPALDKKLIDLLKSLSPTDWNKQTVAKHWSVKDVVAHLLDGNMRVLSALRDNYVEEKSNTIDTYTDLVHYLNKLNADWVVAMKRVSPSMLILLHEINGPLFCKYYQSLNPFDNSPFSVAWTGDSVSKNWKHIAREYSEKFLHQQQIRAAIGNDELMIREFFYPFIDTFMLALPYCYRNMQADNGTTVKLTITTPIGGSWSITQENRKWMLDKKSIRADAEVIIAPSVAWKLFSKSIRPAEIINEVTIIGDRKLGEVALTMVSVMA